MSKYLILYLSLYLFPPALLAQQHYTVRGTVIDETGKPFPSVSIFILQSKKGTITNSNGEFSLNIKESETVLTASHIGYETFSTKITPQTNILQIQLTQKPFQLNEVVVNSLSATELLKSAIKKIPDNYELTPFLTKAYYRAKASENDTLLYMEEAAFEIVKSYQSGFDDKYFLVKNRNFRFVPDKINWRGIGQYDFVDNASQLFNNSFFRNRNISYLPSTTFDDRPVYVLSISPNKGKENFEGKIYIDVEDLAFIRFEIKGEDSRERYAQYKKIEEKYYLMSGHSIHLNKNIGKSTRSAETNMITTDIIHTFSKEDIKGTPVNTDDILEGYATQQQDTLFWENHNAILPDATIQQAVINFQQTKKDTLWFDSLQYQSYLKRLYVPNISLSFSTEWAKDFSSLNQNSVSISHTVNHLFMKKFGKWGLATSILYYLFSMPFEEALSEQRLLHLSSLEPKMNPTIFNNTSYSYIFGINNDALNNYKTNNYNGFMRLHTIRNDGHFVKAQILEEELAKVDLSNKNNKAILFELYFLELFMYRSLTIYNPFEKDQKSINVSEEKQPLIIDKNRSWVKYLFEPEAEYDRHVLQDNLSNEAQRYLQRSAWLSWINLFSPQMFGIKKFNITKSSSFTFSLNYLRVPFGEMFGQNIYLTTGYNQLHGIYLKQYKNHEKTTFGIGYKLFDLKLFKNTFVNTTLDYWKQPTEFQFYADSFSNGFHVGQMIEHQFFPNKYTHQNRMSLLIGYDFKTTGYMPQSYFSGKNFDVKFGFKYLID
ncbi:MAG: carboxypeptidase-like regulatory domain-containing protein [Candidatus Symbiothrix sp.]|jgi:hypothetical protein|nr:carboxypeptidase-like regulatory domain-containing protein [Candidatus Symbiothrix sp.]